ncbi:MAG TPA: hypothetical protein VJS66_07320 [Burkholderiales bacterium]|nr:hypothetical protein [Burkholderiales bacterium]
MAGFGVRILTPCLVQLLAIVSIAPATASNLNFLYEAPGTLFNETDRALFKQTMTLALNESNDGESRRWLNPDTKNSGEVKVARTLPGEQKCRELVITNRAAGRSNTQHTVFCYEASKDRWAMRADTTTNPR